jgi:glycine betaine/proline transport system substrate-binding protein
VIEGDAKRKLEAKAPNLKASPTWGNTRRYSGRRRTGQGALLQLPGRLDLRAGQQRNAQELAWKQLHQLPPGHRPGAGCAVLSSYKRGEPILFYYWSPTPLMGQVDLVKLDEKPGVDKIREHQGRSVEDLPRAGAGTGGRAGKGQPADRSAEPEPGRMTKDRIESAKLAKIFLKEHPEVWHSWVSEDAAKKVDAAPEGGRVWRLPGMPLSSSVMHLSR